MQTIQLTSNPKFGWWFSSSSNDPIYKGVRVGQRYSSLSPEDYALYATVNPSKTYPLKSFKPPKENPQLNSTCPNCSDVYPDCKISDFCDGRVGCLKCGHTWAIPIPDEPRKINYGNGRIFNGPKPFFRTIDCAYCGKAVSGNFTRNQKFCCVKCYEDDRRIKNRNAYREKRKLINRICEVM